MQTSRGIFCFCFLKFNLLMFAGGCKIHSWTWDAISSIIFPNIMNNLSEIKYT